MNLDQLRTITEGMIKALDKNLSNHGQEWEFRVQFKKRVSFQLIIELDSRLDFNQYELETIHVLLQGLCEQYAPVTFLKFSIKD